MRIRIQAIVVLCMFTFFNGCASVDSQIAQDLRHTLLDTKEIGYGTGHGTSVKLLGKINEEEDIIKVINMLKFGEEPNVISQEPLDRYIFFMNTNKTMTTIRFEEGKIQYQGNEYIMDSETRDYLNEYYQ